MSQPVLKAHLDFETRSTVDLKKAGMYRYAEDPTTEIVTMSWRLGDGPVQRWRPGQPWPVLAPDTVVAHNAGFERAILTRTLGKIIVPGDQDCTMARAAAMGLPSSLEALGAALNAPIQKDKDGHRLMLKMCRPRTLEPLTWHENPDEIERLQSYCDRDVEAECEVDAHLPPLSERERRVWELDQRVNDRGVAVDVPLIRAASAAVTTAKKAANDKIWRLTNGAVRKCTEAAKLVDWLNARGIKTTSVASEVEEDLLIVADMLGDELAADVLAVRGSAAKAFKFEGMLNTVCKDGRVRGSLAYHGTISGRWAGRGMQPQNFKRIETEEDEVAVAEALDALRDGRPVADLDTLSMAARPMIIAPPERRLYGGDFSNIEGRMAAYLAGEDWKLDAFRAYDTGTGPDLYKVMASRGLSKDIEEITRADRQLHGKVPELACQFQGGRSAIQKSGLKAGVRIPGGQADKIKNTWRAENPAIVKSWWELQDAAIEAVSAQGTVVSVLRDKVRYVSNGEFLFCRLPSHRVIAYPKPTVAWKSRTVSIDGDDVEINSRGVSYWGTHQGRFMQLDLYGGLQCAHVVSGTARDVLVEAMFAVEAARYPIVLTIHDEILSETNADFGSVEDFTALMERPISWLPDFPLVAKAWTGERYMK